VSRIETARRKLRIARYAIGITAATALAAFAAVARSSHPATHGTTTAASPAAATSGQDSNESSGFFGNGGDDQSSIAPSSGSTPQVQSGAS
jgi:hypothetical protein